MREDISLSVKSMLFWKTKRRGTDTWRIIFDDASTVYHENTTSTSAEINFWRTSYAALCSTSCTLNDEARTHSFTVDQRSVQASKDASCQSTAKSLCSTSTMATEAHQIVPAKLCSIKINEYHGLEVCLIAFTSDPHSMTTPS